jgi:ribA/ribD-fused uncharacterized protein
VKRNLEADPTWVEAVRDLTKHGIADPGLLVLILMKAEVRLPSGRFEMGGGYPRALATVAAALGSDPTRVEAAFIERTARRSDATKLIAAALAALPTIRAALPGAHVGSRLMVYSEPIHLVGFTKHLVKSGAASLPPPRSSAVWKRLIQGLRDAGTTDQEALILLTRFRRVTLASGEIAEPLEDDDAFLTVAEAFGSSYEVVRDGARARFEKATLVRGPYYAQSAVELEGALARLPEVLRVERLVDDGAIVAKRRPDGGLPQAPWDAYSEGPSSMRWRMGPGEDFMGSWQEYWTELDLADRAFYLADKKPPPEWSGWIDGWPAPPTKKPPRKIHFYGVNQPFGFMSNFARAAIMLDGRRWPTSEHYFQAQKFAGQALEEQVRAARTPMEAATLGRSLPGLRPDWDAAKDDVMLTALRAKFSQHAYLRTELLATGDAILVEHTTNDHYWADGGDGTGQNRLGELLMQVRTELREAGEP